MDRVQQGGFSLVELMIGITLGLLILAALATVFTQSSQARNEVERNNRQIENGRYAMSILSEDLRLAGYLSSFDPYQLIIKPGFSPLDTVSAMPDPCNTTLSGNPSSWMNSFFYHIQGVDNASSIPSCISDVRAGTDIVVIRRISTCVAGPVAGAGCDSAIAGVPYFQASNCYANGELINNGSGVDYLHYFVLSTDTSAATMFMHKVNCSTIADFSRYMVRIYFVANNNVGTDGVPTLKRAELGSSGFTIVPLVEGIENLQLEYGVDYTGGPLNTADGIVDAFTANPSAFNSCSGKSCVLNWLNTYAVKLNILARNTEASPGYVDGKTYGLGQNADGTNNTVGPFNDAFKRHVYNSVVRLENPASRRTP